jgi:bifunctional UDP-N-acetylglucosamine pyrophosphorylase/glucosamine-1-phosphate N-acetyltransferase
VLHLLAGRSLLQHVLNAAAGLGADRTLVITGHGADAVRDSTAGSPPCSACARCRSSAPAMPCSRLVPHLPDTAAPR